jgi:hypothetical protein
MSKLTLKSLAQRVDALERTLKTRAAANGPKDWRSVVGMFGGSDFMKKVDEEGRRIREADRRRGRRNGATA